MRSEPRWEIVLAKEDFKFSAAHFTIFGEDEAERLHGHNYRVSVAVSGPELGREGLLFDIAPFKREIRQACARLDERTLVPETSPRLDVTEEGDSLGVVYAGRRYLLPRQDVLRLPVRNVTMELLARLLWQQLAPYLQVSGADRLEVTVEETAGQRCCFTAPLTRDE